MKTIKKFLKKCTAKLDTYNMDECVSVLNDENSVEIARVDHNNSIFKSVPSIWIGENERILTEKEADYILNYLFDQTKHDLMEWKENYNDNYDVRDEQGLYGYGY